MSQAQGQATLFKIGSFSTRELSILIALMLPTLISLINVGMLGVALPVIQTEFGISVDLLSWVVAAGFLLRVPTMPIYGRIGDIFDKKRLYLIGLIIFISGTSLGMMAPTFLWLICGRILEGLGSAASLPLAMALIVDAFPEERRGRALGIWNAAAPAGMTFGPVIGGVVVEEFGWRAIFVIATVGTLVALCIVVWFIPAPSKPKTRPKVDWLGAIALALMITGLLLATTTASVVPFGSPLNLMFWGIGGLALLILIWNAVYRPNPFIGFDIVRNRQFVIPSIAMNLRMFVHDGVRFLTILYLANVFGLSPSMVGFFILFYAIPLLIGVAYGGFLADRWAGRTIGSIGMVLVMAAMLWLSRANPDAGGLTLAPGLILAGLGGAICLAPFTKTAVVALGQDRVGLAAGLYNTVRFAAVATATPLLGLLLAYGFAQHGGLETVSEPYQLGFQLLAVVAGLGIGAALLIPVTPDKDSLPEQSK